MQMLKIAKIELRNNIRGYRFIGVVIVLTLILLAGMSFFLTLTQMFMSLPEIVPRRVPKVAFRIINSLNSIIGMAVPIIAIIMGFDTISGKIEKGITKMILAQPVYRDHLILGSLLSGIITLLIGIIPPVALSLSIAVSTIGITPTIDDVLLLLGYLIITWLFSLSYYAISVLISTISKNSTKSLMMSMIVWLIFIFILPMMATAVAMSILGPPKFTVEKRRLPDGRVITIPRMDIEYMKKMSEITNLIRLLSPNAHFERCTSNLIANRPIDYTNIAVLVLLPIIALLISFIIFVKREVR